MDSLQEGIPLFARCGDVGAAERPDPSSIGVAEAATDLIVQLHHAYVALGLVVCRLQPYVLQEGEDLRGMPLKSTQQIELGSTGLSVGELFFATIDPVPVATV